MIIKCMNCGQLCEGVAFPSEDGTLWIDDAETDEQLAEFKVIEED